MPHKITYTKSSCTCAATVHEFTPLGTHVNFKKNPIYYHITKTYCANDALYSPHHTEHFRAKSKMLKSRNIANRLTRTSTFKSLHTLH
jgi:hypothetical protein